MSDVDGEAQHAALQGAVSQLAPSMEELVDEQNLNDATSGKLSAKVRRQRSVHLASKKIVATLYAAAVSELGEELADTRSAVVMSGLEEGELDRLRHANRDKDGIIHQLSLDMLQARYLVITPAEPRHAAGRCTRHATHHTTHTHMSTTHVRHARATRVLSAPRAMRHAMRRVVLQAGRDARALLASERQKAAATEARLRELLRKGAGKGAGSHAGSRPQTQHGGEAPPAEEPCEEPHAPPPETPPAATVGGVGLGAAAAETSEVGVQTEEAAVQTGGCDATLPTTRSLQGGGQEATSLCAARVPPAKGPAKGPRRAFAALGRLRPVSRPMLHRVMREIYELKQSRFDEEAASRHEGLAGCAAEYWLARCGVLAMYYYVPSLEVPSVLSL